ncbi:MAG: NAD-dependent epimerase/dehydratase family protein [Ornithinimicrobium sp.]|uniref:NAD-dependent epimerase/dehydratase family protein n=1 Tax=Ornithinimicrobium sp. TaxID=1977084 RepID=UPI001835D20F|nr:NAD-dependent epimerase/dehydratase family protein [Actinomycetota bacterium]
MTGPLRVLVTGGSGFIGRHVVAALHGAGHDAVVADLDVFADGEVPTIEGDLCDPEVRERAITSDLDAVVHLAAFTSVLRSVQQPADVHATNVEMTAGLLEAARVAGVGTFVFASTNAVIGDVGQDTIVETMPLAPLTPYGGTKAAAEMLLSGYAGSFGMRCPVLRLTNVYGGGMSHKDSFVPRLMRAAAEGGEVQIYGDGEQRRDLVFVGDVARAASLAVADWPSGPVIIGGSRSYTVNAITQAARDATDRPIRTRHVPAKPGEMPAVVVDIARARARGFEPGASLVEGMREAWVEFAPDIPQD